MRHHARFAAFAIAAVLTGAMAGCGQLLQPPVPQPAPAPTPSPGPGPSSKMSAGSARLSDGDSGRTVELAIGGTLVIDLEENPTTGFSWIVGDPVPAVLRKTGDKYQSPEDQGLVGAAGRHVWTYEAAAAGEGKLALSYSRPWESVQPAKTFVVTVVVR